MKTSCDVERFFHTRQKDSEFALMVCEITSWFIWNKYRVNLSASLYYFSIFIFFCIYFSKPCEMSIVSCDFMLRLSDRWALACVILYTT